MLEASRPHERLSAYLGVLEILVLGPLAALIVLWLIPATFEIEWRCVGQAGVQRVSGDAYIAAVVVAGTFGWLLVLIGEIYAHIAESQRLALLLPIAWFAVFVAAALIAAISMGSQLCPS